MPPEPNADTRADTPPDAPLVGEKDRQWIEAMRAGDAANRRWRRANRPDAETSRRRYRILMQRVTGPDVPRPAQRTDYDPAILKLVRVLSGRRADGDDRA